MAICRRFLHFRYLNPVVKIFSQIITSNFLPLTQGLKPDFLTEPPFFTVTSPSSLKRKRNLTEPNFGESFPTRWAPNPLKRRGWSNSTYFRGETNPTVKHIIYVRPIRGVVITCNNSHTYNDAKGAHRSLFSQRFSVYSLIDRPPPHVLAIARKVLAKHATIPSLDFPRWFFTY